MRSFFFVQSESFVTNRIPFTILLGVVCGLMSYYFTKVMFMMESMFSKLRHTGLKILVGGVIMAGLIFLFPPLYGEGYEAINNLLLGDVSNIVDRNIFLCRPRQRMVSYPLHRSHSFDKGIRHIRNQRSRRCRRNIRSFFVRRSSHLVSVCVYSK